MHLVEAGKGPSLCLCTPIEMNPIRAATITFSKLYISSDASTESSGSTIVWVRLHKDMSTKTMAESFNAKKQRKHFVHAKQPKHKQEHKEEHRKHLDKHTVPDIQTVAATH